MTKFNRNLKIFLLVVGIIAVVLSSGRIFSYDIFGRQSEKKDISIASDDKTSALKDLIPGFASSKHEVDEDIYFIYDEDGNLLNYVLFSSPYCDDIKGFGGTVPLAVVFTPDYKIQQILLLNHSESKSWINRLEKIDFFNEWDGLSAEEALLKDIDAVSGATLTSAAVIESINCRLSQFVSVSDAGKKINWINILGIIASFMVLALALFSFFVPQQSKGLRWILLLASVGILGFWQGDFLSMALLHNWLINGLDIKVQIFLFILLLSSLLLPIITNKSFYCQYVCPFGAAQELVGKVNKKKVNLGYKVTSVLRSLRFIFLFIITVLLVVAVDVKLEELEPFGAFKFQYASLTVLILAVVMLFLSIFFNKPWCRFLCPTGALLSLLRGNTKKMKHRKFNIPVILNIILVIAVLVLTYFLIRQPKSDTINIQNESIMREDNINLLFNRKSVRSYTQDEVSKETLETLVKAGMAAPSARNMQPWSFIIVRDKKILNSLGESLANAQMVKNAQAAIIVCGDLTRAYTEVDEDYWVQDCSAASQNILLAAEALGLGAVWTAAYPYPDRVAPVRQFLGLPDHIIPLNVIPIGYPDGDDKPKDKWNPENVHWEKW